MSEIAELCIYLWDHKENDSLHYLDLLLLLLKHTYSIIPINKQIKKEMLPLKLMYIPFNRIREMKAKTTKIIIRVVRGKLKSSKLTIRKKRRENSRF